jgi:hypothetical protein
MNIGYVHQRKLSKLNSNPYPSSIFVLYIKLISNSGLFITNGSSYKDNLNVWHITHTLVSFRETFTLNMLSI